MIGNDGAYIVASSNPSAGQDSFKQIASQQDLFDYPAYHYSDSIFGGSVWDMVGYNGKLYATIVTGKNGDRQPFALICGEQNPNTEKWEFHVIAGAEKDGASYPFGLGSNRSGAANLIVYNDELYIGGYNDPMIALPDVLSSMDFENIYTDLSSPVCLWKMGKDETIQMVAGEANEVFPEGPLGNMGSGFGNNLNQYVWRMENFDGKLYVGTFDIGSLAYPLMQFTNGDVLKMSKEDWLTQIQYIKEFLKLLKQQGQGSSVRTYQVDNTEMVTKQMEYISNTMSDMAGLLEITPSNDTNSTNSYASRSSYATNTDTREQFYSMLTKLFEAYRSIREQLPTDLTQNLDRFLNQDTIDNFKYFIGTCSYLSEGERGFDLLVSDDGVNFSVITRNGFGDPYNHGLRVFAITNSGLSIGTANPFYGTQIWNLVDNTKLPFVDVQTDDWFYDAVNYVYQNNIMTGTTPTTFDPAVEMNRAQFATVLYRMAGQPDVEYQNYYEDVPNNWFYSDAVTWGTQNNIITGYQNGYFGTTVNITREQLITMLYRYAQYQGYDVSQTTSLNDYSDGALVSVFSKDAMEWALAVGIIKGENNEGIINPQGDVGRAVGATILMRFMELYQK